jgi:hypothetical protein
MLSNFLSYGVSSVKPDRNSSEVHGNQGVAGGFVVAGRDSAERLQLAKEVLDPVACLLQIFVIVALRLAVRPGRNHGGFSGLRQRR